MTRHLIHAGTSVDKWHLDEDIAGYRALVTEYRAAPEADQ